MKGGLRSCSNVDETGGRSLGNEILNELHTDQVEKEEIIDHDGTIPERTSRSARCDDDFRKNLEFLPENEVVEMESGSEKRPHAAEKRLERREDLGGHEEFEERGSDLGADRLPQERTLYSSSDISLNGAINPLLSSNEEVKGKEHNNGSKASPMDLGQRRSYLRDQALLSDSWMSDGSFGKLTEGGVRVCCIAVLGFFWCGVAVIFISKYGIAVFRAQAVCGEFKFYVAVVGEKIVVSR